MRYAIKRNETIVARVPATGTQQREAMGIDLVEMLFSLPQYIKFELNDWVEVYGQVYKLNVNPTVEKKARRRYEYNMQLEAEFYDLAKVQMQGLDPQNNFLEPVFSVVGNAAVLMALIVENANRFSSGWVVGLVVDTEYQNFTFNTQNCLQALHEVAAAFATEFWIDGKIINLHPRQQEAGVVFEYGKGHGLYNIRRSQKNNSNLLTRLYVRGGTQNLPANYGFRHLLLPDQEPYLQEEAKVNQYGLIEASKIFNDIFPKREGTVTAVVAGAGNWMYFTDSTLDFDINQQLAPGLEAKVTFNSGQLGGYTFTINNYNPATKQFTINKHSEETALDLPNDLMRPEVGDKYVLIDIIMPLAYVSEAQLKLQAAAQAYYDQNSNPANLLEYSANCDRQFIKDKAIEVILGNTAIIHDGEMVINATLRIAKYNRDLQDAYNYTDVTWSESIAGNAIVRQYAEQKKILQLLNSSSLLSNRDFLSKLSPEYMNQQIKNALNAKTEWQSIVLPAGFASQAGHEPQYMKDHLGFVHLRGYIAVPSNYNSGVFFTLPTGLRPDRVQFLPCFIITDEPYEKGRLIIYTSGGLAFSTQNISGSISMVGGSLDGVSFYSGY